MSGLAEKAAAVLTANDRHGRYTVPSPHLYPHQWAWDSAFAAIGWAHLDLDRALTELECLLGGAWPDGRVPHILFHDRDGTYFPGPDFWGTEWTSSITQPPAWAIALRRLHALGADPARLAALIAPIDASHRFFHKQRDPLRMHAVAVVHPWESGLDNSPAWDRPMQAVDPAAAPAFKRVDKERVDDADQRPTDTEYKRYAALVKGIADDDFGPGAFAVYDPLMTSLLVRAEDDLAHVAEALGVETAAADRAVVLRAGLEGLYDEALGRYGFLDARAERFEQPDVLAAYAPLILEDLEPLRAATLRAGLEARFATDWPLPSTAPSDPAFDAQRYWRGPAWVNMNWLFAPHVDLPVRERTLELVEREGFREYYHPHTGRGLGARQFAWTAALVLDWLKT